MTFEKYKQGREKFNDTVFPIDEYEYDYVFDKKIGWYYIKGQKTSDMKKQKWDIKIPKEGETMNDLKEILYNQSNEFNEIVNELNYNQRKILLAILLGVKIGET